MVCRFDIVIVGVLDCGLTKVLGGFGFWFWFTFVLLVVVCGACVGWLWVGLIVLGLGVLVVGALVVI